MGYVYSGNTAVCSKRQAQVILGNLLNPFRHTVLHRPSSGHLIHSPTVSFREFMSSSSGAVAFSFSMSCAASGYCTISHSTPAHTRWMGSEVE